MSGCAVIWSRESALGKNGGLGCGVERVWLGKIGFGVGVLRYGLGESRSWDTITRAGIWIPGVRVREDRSWSGRDQVGSRVPACGGLGYGVGACAGDLRDGELAKLETQVSTMLAQPSRSKQSSDLKQRKNTVEVCTQTHKRAPGHTNTRHKHVADEEASKDLSSITCSAELDLEAGGAWAKLLFSASASRCVLLLLRFLWYANASKLLSQSSSGYKPPSPA